VTAIAERRTRRTRIAAAAALAMTVVAGALVVVGVITLSNSQAGEAVGVDDRPRIALPATPNALLAATDEEGRLASLVILTLSPEWSGGSIVTIPVNADGTAGFGVQRRPLDAFFDPTDPEGLVLAVEDMLSITIERAAVVDPAGLEALLAPIGPVQVVLPDAVVDSDAVGAPEPDGDAEPDGDGEGTGEGGDGGTEPAGVIVSAGPQVLDTAQIVTVLTAIDDDVPAYLQHPLDVAMWTALAEAESPGSPPPPVTDDAGQLVAPASVDALMVSLFSGEVGVRDIAADEPSEQNNPTGADVVVLDRFDAALVFGQISPALVSTPSTGSSMRIVGQFTDEQLAVTDGLYESGADLMRVLIGRMLFLGANIVSIDTTPSGAGEVTVVEVTDPRALQDWIEASAILFGDAEVRVAESVIEGIDVVVTLGTSYLRHEMETDWGDPGDEPDPTTPTGTVEDDG
jgi:hypothetical protein